MFKKKTPRRRKLPDNPRLLHLPRFVEAVLNPKIKSLFISLMIVIAKDNCSTILSLRQVSRDVTVAISTGRWMDACFRTLYAFPRNRSPELRQSWRGWRVVRSHCRELVVKLCKQQQEDPNELLYHWLYEDLEFAPGTIFTPAENEEEKRERERLMSINAEMVANELVYNEPTCGFAKGSDWPEVFKNLPNLEVLSITTSSHPGGVSLTAVSDSLIALRIALERAKLPKFHSLHLLPIHAAYVPHFQWSGPSMGEARFWAPRTMSQITTLEMQILSPLANAPLSKSHHAQLTKTIYAFLKSFSANLHTLRWTWTSNLQGQELDEGPHPFGFDTELPRYKNDPTRSVCPPFSFLKLKELWVGRIKDEPLKRQHVQKMCPVLERYMVLSYGKTFLDWRDDGVREKWDDPLFLLQREITMPERAVDTGVGQGKDSVDTVASEGTAVATPTSRRRRISNSGVESGREMLRRLFPNRSGSTSSSNRSASPRL